MDILIDARALVETFDGISRYSLNMIRTIRELRPGWSISAFIPRNSAFHLSDLEVLKIIENTPRFRLSENSVLAPLINTLSPDVYLNFSMAGPVPRVPSVVTVHDLMVLNIPDYFGAGRLRSLASRTLFRMLIHRSVSHASLVSVPSFATERELQEKYRSTRDRTVVTGEGQNLFDCREPVLDNRQNFLLYVGNARSYKNLPRLVSAWSRVMRDMEDSPRLVMVVRQDRAFEPFMQLLEEKGLLYKVEVISHVTDDRLRELYSTCRALLMPSIHEGFGLPVLEAMAVGTPVLASKGTALEELLGDTGELVDPSSVDDIARGIKVVSSPSFCTEELACRTVDRASEYTWERAATRLIDALEQLV